MHVCEAEVRSKKKQAVYTTFRVIRVSSASPLKTAHDASKALFCTAMARKTTHQRTARPGRVQVAVPALAANQLRLRPRDLLLRSVVVSLLLCVRFPCKIDGA